MANRVLRGLAACLTAAGLVGGLSLASAQADADQVLTQRPQLSVPKQVTAGKSMDVSYTVTAHPRGGSLAIQRTFGTSNVFKTIYKSTKWKGSTSVTAPPMGTYSFRLEVLTHHRKVAAVSKTHTVYSYDTVTLGTILKRGTRTVDNNGTLFTYVWKTGTCYFDDCGGHWFRILKRNTTTCRSMSLQSLYKPYQNESGSVATIQLEQVAADPQQQTVNPNTVTGFGPSIGGAYVLRVHATPTSNGNGGEFYLDGSASCYGTHG